MTIKKSKGDLTDLDGVFYLVGKHLATEYWPLRGSAWLCGVEAHREEDGYSECAIGNSAEGEERERD